MTTYTAPLREMRFVLHELFDAPAKLTKLPGFEEATADLMERFYRHLRAGESKDEALRAAQLEMLARPAASARLRASISRRNSRPSRATSSAFCFSAASFASSFVEPNGHGVPSEPSAATGVNTPPCMSWHWFGVIQTKFGVVEIFDRSAASEV